MTQNNNDNEIGGMFGESLNVNGNQAIQFWGEKDAAKRLSEQPVPVTETASNE